MLKEIRYLYIKANQRLANIVFPHMGKDLEIHVDNCSLNKIFISTNIKYITAKNNQIIDIHPHNSLESLAISHNNLSDITNINNLKSLKKLELLDLRYNGISFTKRFCYKNLSALKTLLILPKTNNQYL